MVHHILDTFFAKKDGRPLPPKPVLVPNLNPSMGRNVRTPPVPPHRLGAAAGAVLALCGLGVAMIYSTTATRRATSHGFISRSRTRSSLGLIAMIVTLSLDYRTFTDKSHFIYIGMLALLLYVMFFGTVQMGARAVDCARRSSTCSRPSSRRSAWRSCSPSSSARTAARPRGRTSRLAACSPLIPLALIAKEPDLGTAVTLVPVFVADRVSRRDADAHPRHPALVCAASRRPSPGSSRSRTIRSLASRRSSIRRRMRKAPGTSRSRRASRSARAGFRGRGSGRGRRASCGSFPSPTTISSSRCWPRSRGLPASSWRSACICS